MRISANITNCRSGHVYDCMPFIRARMILMYLFFILTVAGTMAQDNLSQYLGESVNNPGLKAKYKEYEAAMENIVQMGFLSDPSLSAGVFINPVETRLGAQRLKISASQMFPWFGTVQAKEQMAAMQALSKYENYLFYMSKLHFDLKTTWFDLFLNKKESEIIEKHIEVMKLLEKQAYARFESGLSGMTEVLHFQMEIDELESNYELLLDKRKNLIAKFNTFLDKDPAFNVILPDTILYSSEGIFSIDSVIENNHEIRSLKSSLEAAFSSEIISRKMSKPQIGVGLDYVVVSKRNDASPSGNGKDILMPMATISLPVFKKKNQSRINKSLLLNEQLALVIENKVAQIKLDYRISIQQYNDAIRKKELYKELINKNTMSLNIAKAGYISSKIKYDEVLKIFQSDYNYKIMFYKAIVQEKRIIASLEYLVGK